MNPAWLAQVSAAQCECVCETHWPVCFIDDHCERCALQPCMYE